MQKKRVPRNQINSLGKHGNYPIHDAVQLRGPDTEIVQFLLNNGAKVNKKNQEGETALHLAAYNGHLEVVKLLLEMTKGFNKIKVDKKDKKEETALHLAAYNGHLEVAKLLLKQKEIKINAEDYPTLRTPLFLAVLNCHKEVVDLLLKNNADTSIQGLDDNNNLVTALELAKSRKNDKETDPNKVPDYAAIITALQARGAK